MEYNESQDSNINSYSSNKTRLMRALFSCLFFFLFILCEASEKSDSLKSKLEAGATFSLNSNGIASIPAFSLDKPAVMASLSLAKNRFSYTPTLAYGLDMRPWFIDNWFNYKIIRKPVFDLTAGFNISTFGSKYEAAGEDTNKVIWQAQRYFAFALTGVYRISPNNTLTIAYWNDRGQDPGTIKGHFFNVVGERSGINIGKKVLLSAALQVFYINYEGNNDGLFISPKVSSTLRDAPFAVFFQAIQALQSNIEPFPGFRWNLGISYTL
jgi:hypothetical protein